MPNQVVEVTLDMADSMRKIVRRCFPNARRVTDRFQGVFLTVFSIKS